MLPPADAFWVAGAFAVLIYFLFLSRIFSIMRFNRHLKERWEQYGKGGAERLDSISLKMEERRLGAFQGQNRLKALLSHPYPSLKMAEFLLYRSGVYPNLKIHLAGYCIGVVIASEAIFIFSHLSLVNSILSGIVMAGLLHFLFLRFKESKWQKAFLAIFPLSLDIINRGLKSGLTLGRGIAVVSEEMDDPVGSEFNYMASQLELGVNPDDALNEAASRIGVEEFRFFALALIIQREMGGSLADILGKLSEVIRERERFRKKVWTLSSESRATAMIVGFLPVFLGIMVELISPGYIRFFFVDPKGLIMLWISVGLTLTGTIVIIRMMSLRT